MDNIEPKAGDVLVDKMGNRYIVLINNNNNEKIQIARIIESYEGSNPKLEPSHEDTWEKLKQFYTIEQKGGKKYRHRRHKKTHRRHKKTQRLHKKTHRRNKRL